MTSDTRVTQSGGRERCIKRCFKSKSSDKNDTCVKSRHLAMASVRVWEAQRREGTFGQREQYQQRHRGSKPLELLTKKTDRTVRVLGVLYEP